MLQYDTPSFEVLLEAVEERLALQIEGEQEEVAAEHEVRLNESTLHWLGKLGPLHYALDMQVLAARSALDQEPANPVPHAIAAIVEAVVTSHGMFLMAESTKTSAGIVASNITVDDRPDRDWPIELKTKYRQYVDVLTWGLAIKREAAERFPVVERVANA